jgi:hypothetical protein
MWVGYRVFLEGALFLEEAPGVYENVIDGVTWSCTSTDFGPNGELPIWKLESSDGSLVASGNKITTLNLVLQVFCNFLAVRSKKLGDEDGE